MLLVRSLLAGAAAVIGAPAFAATLVVGAPDWPSAQVTARIIATVLEDRYGVEARVRDIGTIELFDAIDRGEVDIHPEIWLPNLQSFVDDYVEGRGTIALSPTTVDASQHICTTRATQEMTGLTSLADLADPEMAAQFDTDADGRGELWIGAHGWSSTRVERVRARSYGYDETMLLLTAPEEVAMASVDVAAATGGPIVFYCYAPHHVFELHDIVRLEEPAHDPSTWTILSPEEDVAWLSKSEAGSAWEPSSYRVGYASELREAHGEVAAFLDAIALTAEEAAKMSYAMEVERKSADEVAAAWVDANGERIEEWAR